MRYSAENKKDTTALENFYYASIYDIICAPLPPEAKSTHLRHLKAKITRLHHYERKKILRNNAEGDVMEGEEPTLFHYMKAKKKNDARTVLHIQDADNKIQTAPLKILHVFTEYFSKKIDTIPVQMDSIQQMINAIPNTIPPESHIEMDAPFTINDLKQTIRKGKLHKAPGCGGIGHDVYAKTWDICKDDMLQTLNTMYIEVKITETQKRGLIVYITKKKSNTHR
jgi:hypothetical protein